MTLLQFANKTRHEGIILVDIGRHHCHEDLVHAHAYAGALSMECIVDREVMYF